MLSVKRQNGQNGSCPFCLFLILTVIFLLIAVFFLRNVLNDSSSQNLRIVDEYGKQILVISEVEEFQLVHTHSVAKTPVVDYYEIRDRNTIVQTRMDYYSYGAGLPTNGRGDYQIIDGAMVVDDLSEEHSEIRIRVGRVSEQHLVVNEETIYLKDLAMPGEGLILKPEPRKIFR